MVSDKLPSIPALLINLRNYLSILLICDVGLRTEETSLHLKVLLLVVYGVKKVTDGFNATEMEFILDLEKFCACW